MGKMYDVLEYTTIGEICASKSKIPLLAAAKADALADCSAGGWVAMTVVAKGSLSGQNVILR